MNLINTPEKVGQVFYSMQLISMYAELISIECQKLLVDHKFTNPTINNYSNRLKEAPVAISKECLKYIKGKDMEYFKYEHAPALAELYPFFAFMPLEELNANLEQIEELRKSVEV